jgi:hypothetical protein
MQENIVTSSFSIELPGAVSAPGMSMHSVLTNLAETVFTGTADVQVLRRRRFSGMNKIRQAGGNGHSRTQSKPRNNVIAYKHQ